jgi:DNA-directed RNA polymerase subunit M/transcription elongation factor TFIIS
MPIKYLNIYIYSILSKMKFCSVCDMYYYISIDENDNKIVYYCRNCGNKEESSLDGHLRSNDADPKNRNSPFTI